MDNESPSPAMMKSSEFFLPGGRDGVLLIHGLTGTPAEMRFVGKGLHRAGYSVFGMQLAGHCGNEADLLATGWRDWYQSVTEAADFLAGRVDRLFVGGLSMGALLALKLAAERPAQINGLALYGTTFAYDGWTIPRIAKLSFLLPLAIRLGIGRKQRFMEKPPYGIKCERVRQRIREATVVDLRNAERRAADVEHVAARAHAVRARGGRPPVDRKERRRRHRGGRALPSHFAAASSSLVRASTQRTPAGVLSFFQNGARVFR